MKPEALHRQKTKKLSYRAKIKKLFPFIKLLPKVVQLLHPCFLTFFISHIFKLITTAVNVQKSKYLGDIADIISGNAPFGELKTLIIHLVAIYLIFRILLKINMMMNARIIKTLNKDIKSNLYKNILEKDMEFFDRKSPYDAVDTINSGVEAVQGLATQRIHGTLNPILKAIGTAVLLFNLSHELTCMVLLITPFIIYFQTLKRKSNKPSTKVANVVKEAEIPAYSKKHFLLIKAFSTEKQEHTQFVEKADKCVVTAKHSHKKFLSLKIFKGMVFGVFQILLLSCGGVMMFKDKLTFGDLVKYNLYFSEFVPAITSALTNFKELLKSLAKSEEFFKLVEYEPKIQLNNRYTIEKKTVRGSITLRRVSFSYPTKSDVPIFEHISFDIKNNERVGFVGAPHSGKTTLAYLLMRLYDVTEGKIFVGGENIKSYDVTWLHQNMGYVPEDGILLDGTIEENLLYGSDQAKLEGIRKILVYANAEFILNKTRFPQGLQTQFQEQTLNNFSNSERKRLAIARALVKNPKILILDEPSCHTSSMEEEREMQIAVDRLMQLKDKTIIIISKSPAYVQNCEKVYSIENRRIIEKN